MYSEEYFHKIARLVFSGNLKGVNELMEEDKETFNIFLSYNNILLDEWIDHVFDVYREGGLKAAA
jgi:hypothetical protein